MNQALINLYDKVNKQHEWLLKVITNTNNNECHLFTLYKFCTNWLVRIKAELNRLDWKTKLLYHKDYTQLKHRIDDYHYSQIIILNSLSNLIWETWKEQMQINNDNNNNR